MTAFEILLIRLLLNYLSYNYFSYDYFCRTYILQIRLIFFLQIFLNYFLYINFHFELVAVHNLKEKRKSNFLGKNYKKNRNDKYAKRDTTANGSCGSRYYKQ